MAEDLSEWKRSARNAQQAFCDNFGDRMFDRLNKKQLARKVGYALYGEPDLDESMNIATYTKHQQDNITLLSEKIISLQPVSDGCVYFSCIYVLFQLKNKEKSNGMQVVFRIPKFEDDMIKRDSFIFLDPTPRIYNSWLLYLQKNKLPNCYMCFPTNGIYSVTDRSVDLTFEASHSCNKRTRIFNGLDKLSPFILMGATGVSFISAPIVAPLLWGAATTFFTYDVARNVYGLHDIKAHGQSLALKNPDARNAWINLTGSFFGIASVGTTAMVKNALATESVISRAGILSLRLLNVSSVVMSGFGVLNNIATLVVKYLNGTLEKRDILKFINMCFFFFNAIITYNVAQRLIEQVGSDVDFFNLHKDSCFMFIKNVQEFINPTDLLIFLCKKPLKLNSYKFDKVVPIYKYKELVKGKITLDEFCSDMNDLILNKWKQYLKHIQNVIEDIKSMFDIPHWKKLTNQEITNLEILRLVREEKDNVIKTCNINNNSEACKDFIKYAREYSTNRANSDRDFLDRFSVYCREVIAQYNKEVIAYEDTLDAHSESLNDKHDNRDNFDRHYGIEGRKEDFFFSRAINKLNNPDILKNIDILYNCQNTSSKKNLPFIETTNSMLYMLCGPSEECMLADEFYWKKVTELTGVTFNPDNSKITRSGEFVCIRPIIGNDTSELGKIEVVLINTTLVDDCHMGWLLLLLK